MPLTRRHRRIWNWIALVAIFALSALPTVSRALAVAGGTSAGSVICTMQGMVTAIESESLTTDSGLTLQSEHCPFCALSAAMPWLPPRWSKLAADPALRHAFPIAFLQSSGTLPIWRRAQARAPPELS